MRTILEENSDQVYGATIVIFAAIVFASYSLSIAVMLLTPLMFCKLQILPFSGETLQKSGKRRLTLFWGFTITTLFALVIIISYDCLLSRMLFSIATSSIEVFYKLLALPLPLPIISFAIADVYITFRTLSKSYQPKTDSIQSERHLKVCIQFHLFAVVLIVLFLQLLSFHLGWFLLMVITFPLQVGVLFLNYLAIYVALGLFISGIIELFTACSKTHGQEMIGWSCLFFSISSINFAYYITITVVGFHYRDGIGAMMPSLAPIVLVGIVSWAMSKATTKLQDDDTKQKFITTVQQQNSCIDDFNDEKLKDISL